LVSLVFNIQWETYIFCPLDVILSISAILHKSEVDDDDDDWVIIHLTVAATLLIVVPKLSIKIPKCQMEVPIFSIHQIL
jgi:hypothetical protein